MTKKAVSLAVIAALMLGVGAASAAERWIHIRVEDGGEHGETVRVNLPLSMIEKVTSAIDFEEIDGTRFRGGRIHINDADIDKVDLKKLWEAVRDTDDGEFVRVESTDEDVRVAKDGGYLLVRIRSGRDDDEDDDGERVDVKVPLAVVDALLSAGDDELDLQAALEALSLHGDGELVTVQDGRSSVRIWIDDSNTME